MIVFVLLVLADKKVHIIVIKHCHEFNNTFKYVLYFINLIGT